MATTVKDVAWLDAEDTEGSPSTISDPGTGSFPIVEYAGSQGLLYRSSPTNRVIIPWNRVIKVVETDVA